MKFGKIATGAAAVLASLAMASSASAVHVCSLSGTGEWCEGSAGKEYTGSLNAGLKQFTNAVLTATNSSGSVVRTVSCEKSSLEGSVTNPTVGVGVVNKLSLSNCSSSGCTSVSASTPRNGGYSIWETSFWPTFGGTNGTMRIYDFSTKFTATCLFITATCEYEVSIYATLTVSGGFPATLSASSVPVAKTAGAESVCGTKADWSGTYTVSTPSSFYITS